MLERFAYVLLLLTAGAIGLLYYYDVRFTVGEEEAIQRELRVTATTEELNARVSDALDRGDVEDAVMYSEIADYMQRTLPRETRIRLVTAVSTAPSFAHGAADFASGFVTGEGTTIAELAGAVASDLTVVGDVRDIAGEGTKMVAGEEYSELVLGLSVVGLAATGVSVATGGGGLPAKLGVSVLKVAARAGTLTAEFAGVLLRLVRDAANPSQLATIVRSTRLTDLRATENAFTAYARGVREAEIFRVVDRLGELGGHVGPGETVRLMRYVRSSENLNDITAMSARFGKKTRGIIELTGRTSLRAFRLSLNVIEFLVEWIAAFLAWLATIVGLSLTRRIIRGHGRRRAPAPLIPA